MLGGEKDGQGDTKKCAGEKRGGGGGGGKGREWVVCV